MKKNNFLSNKLKGTNFNRLVFLEVESLLYWLFNSLPGTIGFFFRNILAGILFKNKQGFIWIQPRVTLVESDKLITGKHVGINSGSYINAVGGITMGDYVLIGSNVTISSGKHPIEGCQPSVFERPVEPFPIDIEDDVWIGAGSVILPGVRLRKGTVVGANSVVTKDTKEYAIVVGAPARLLRYRVAVDKSADLDLSPKK